MQTEEGAVGQGRQAACGSWKRQGADSPLEPQEWKTALRGLEFNPVRPILDFGPPELKDRFLLFQATEFVVICYCSSQELEWGNKYCRRVGHEGEMGSQKHSAWPSTWPEHVLLEHGSDRGY